MGRRILAFFLGMMFGIILVVGSVVGAAYIAATSLHVSDFYPDSDEFLGDFAHMSIYDIYKSLTDLYNSKIGVTDENGRYFTIGEFLEYYHIDPKLFFGPNPSEDLLEIPAFEFFSKDGQQDALNQVRVSVLFAFINMLTADEDGNAFFTQQTIEKLRMYSMAELLDNDKGLPYVFQEIMLSELLPSMFPTNRTDDNGLMWALGQSSFGRLIGGFQDSFLLEFKPNGVFEALGSLQMTEITGSSSVLLTAIFKDHLVSDLIDDNGNLVPDILLNGVYIGELLGYQRNPVEDTDGYDELYSNSTRTVLSKNIDNDNAYLIVTEDGTHEARLYCTIAEHTHNSSNCGQESDENYPTCGQTEHTHDANCFGYVWYYQTAANESEWQDDDMIQEGIHYNRASGLYTAISDITIGELMDGDSNALMNRMLDCKLRELLEGQEVDGTIEHLQDMTLRELMTGGIDGIFFGVVFGYERNQVTDLEGYHKVNGLEDVLQKDNSYVRKDGNSWFKAELKCEENHTHHSDCYGFIWLDANGKQITTGVKAALSNKTIGDLNNLNETIRNLTLTDVFGEDIPSMLKSLAKTKIGELGEAINKMYLGEFLNYHRKPADETGYTEVVITEDGTVTVRRNPATGGLIALDGETWYTATLNCKDSEHTENTHTRHCYGYIWYEDEEFHTAVEGMIGKLANEKVSDLNGLSDTILSFTLEDVLGENLPTMFKSIKDTQIRNLQSAIDGMYVGEFLDYVRQPADVTGFENVVNDDMGNAIVKRKPSTDEYFILDGDVWYNATSCCIDDTHTDTTHTRDCFGFVWYSCGAEESDSHRHNDDCIATGITGKLANEKISGLGDLNDKIMSFTLKDVLGKNVPDSLKSIQDTPIKDLEAAMENMYLGEFMEYMRYTAEEKYGDLKTVSETDSIKYYLDEETGVTYYAKFDERDNEWYEATLDCVYDHSEDEHDADCFNFVWYQLTCGIGDNSHEHQPDCYSETPVKGVMGKLASITLGELSADTLTQKINNTRLGDVLNLDGEDTNSLLKELADVRIGELSNELNGLYVGTAMGYFRLTVDESITPDKLDGNVYSYTENGETFYCILDVKKNRYYNAKLACKQAHMHNNENCYNFIWYQCTDFSVDGSHNEHNKLCAEEIKGLNDKMSNLTVEELASGQLNGIVTTLTIGDLIDSGMMSLGDNEVENSYKLAIICCADTDHYFTEQGTFPTADKDYYCTLQDFFLYQAYLATKDETITAEEYWNKTHTAADDSHRDSWKEKQVGDFINALLAAI